MRKTTMILTFVLPILAICLQAQSANPSSDAKQTSGKEPDLTMLTGCLRVENNHYLLTEKSNGSTSQLSGAANKLGHQVGREIEVSGKPGIKTMDSTLAGAGSSALEQQVFEVKTVKRVADACQ
jgi:hypothetical protein